MDIQSLLQTPPQAEPVAEPTPAPVVEPAPEPAPESPPPRPQAPLKKRKRTLSMVLYDISPPETVIFKPLKIPLLPLKLCLPLDINSTDPFKLFSLFWP